MTALDKAIAARNELHASDAWRLYGNKPTTHTALCGKHLDACIAALQPAPPPPPVSGKLWGIAPSNDPYVPSVDTQMAAFAALGVNCPRFGGDDTASQAARKHGFKQWVAFVGNGATADIPAVVNYARKYPEAAVTFGNELNLNSSWTVAKVAAMQLQLYKAMKAAGLPNKVMLTSLSQSPSRPENLQNLPWCKKLAAAGCTMGKGFDWADFHCYADNPKGFDLWQHVYTPDGNGDSCISVLGHPPFFYSEFGAQIGKDIDDDAAQAAAATLWVNELKALPGCLGGAWFQMYDGSSRWNGFGLIDVAGNHRPSYQAFQTAIKA